MFTETDRLIAFAAKSGLCDVVELREAYNTLRQQALTAFTNGQSELNAFCDYIVEKNLLTRWQCDKLLAGRYKGFFMGNFKLVGHLGCSETFSLFEAEDVHSKRRVVLRVCPRPRRRDSKPYYEVDETESLQ
jgi:eukaryotic-like serine/threonine-protein kinase